MDGPCAIWNARVPLFSHVVFFTAYEILQVGTGENFDKVYFHVVTYESEN